MINFDFAQLILIPLCVGLVQVIKMTKKVNIDYIPLTSLIVGIVLGMVFRNGNALDTSLLIGIMVGLSASGLFDFGKTAISINLK